MIHDINPSPYTAQAASDSDAQELALELEQFQTTMQQLLQNPNDRGLDSKMSQVLNELKGTMERMQATDPTDYDKIMQSTSLGADFATTLGGPDLSLNYLLSHPDPGSIGAYFQAVAEDQPFAAAFQGDLQNAITAFQNLN
jgi:hypothetical protein